MRRDRLGGMGANVAARSAPPTSKSYRRPDLMVAGRELEFIAALL